MSLTNTPELNFSTPQRIQNAITWIDTLLTTTAKQGTQQLGDAQLGYCCLGLGCFTLDLEYVSQLGFNHAFINAVGLYSISGKPRYLTAAGLPKSAQASLVYLNDRAQWSFKRIGEHLIQWAPYYFKAQVGQAIQAHYQAQK